MPFRTPEEIAARFPTGRLAAGAALPVHEPPLPTPSVKETAVAMFSEDLIGSMVLNSMDPFSHRVDPLYKPDLRGYEDYQDVFLSVFNKEDELVAKRRVDRRRDNLEIMARAPWYKIGVAGLWTGVASPANLAGGLGALSRVKTAGDLARRMAKMAAIGGAAQAGEEVLTHQANPFRTFEESAVNTVVAGGLNAVVGGGSGLFELKMNAARLKLLEREAGGENIELSALRRIDMQAFGRASEEGQHEMVRRAWIDEHGVKDEGSPWYRAVKKMQHPFSEAARMERSHVGVYRMMAALLPDAYGGDRFGLPGVARIESIVEGEKMLGVRAVFSLDAAHLVYRKAGGTEIKKPADFRRHVGWARANGGKANTDSTNGFPVLTDPKAIEFVEGAASEYGKWEARSERLGLETGAISEPYEAKLKTDDPSRLHRVWLIDESLARQSEFKAKALAALRKDDPNVDEAAALDAAQRILDDWATPAKRGAPSAQPGNRLANPLRERILNLRTADMHEFIELDLARVTDVVVRQLIPQLVLAEALRPSPSHLLSIGRYNEVKGKIDTLGQMGLMQRNRFLDELQMTNDELPYLQKLHEQGTEEAEAEASLLQGLIEKRNEKLAVLGEREHGLRDALTPDAGDNLYREVTGEVLSELYELQVKIDDILGKHSKAKLLVEVEGDIVEDYVPKNQFFTEMRAIARARSALMERTEELLGVRQRARDFSAWEARLADRSERLRIAEARLEQERNLSSVRAAALEEPLTKAQAAASAASIHALEKQVLKLKASVEKQQIRLSAAKSADEARLRVAEARVAGRVSEAERALARVEGPARGTPAERTAAAGKPGARYEREARAALAKLAELRRANFTAGATLSHLFRQAARQHNEVAGKLEPKKAAKLKKKFDKRTDDARAMRDRIRNETGIPRHAEHLGYKVERAALNLNVLTSMGSVLIGSLGDPAIATFTTGFSAPARYWISKTRSLWNKDLRAQFKANEFARTVRMYEHAAFARSRFHAMGDMPEGHLGTDRDTLGHVTDWLVAHTFIINQWNSFGKGYASFQISDRILRDVIKMVEGKATKRQVKRLGLVGIDFEMAKRIDVQFFKYGSRAKGATDIHFAQSHLWVGDEQAMRVFDAAVMGDVRRAIITPGIADRPLFMDVPGWRLLGQFQSFGIAAVNKILVPGLLDMGNWKMWLSAAVSVVAGMGVSMLKDLQKFKNPFDRDFDDLLVDGVDRSGVLGTYANFMGTIGKLPPVKALRLAAGLPEEASRFADRNWVDPLAGPTLGRAYDIPGALRAATSAFTDEVPSSGDVRAFRNQIILQNHIGFRYAVDLAEDWFRKWKRMEPRK